MSVVIQARRRPRGIRLLERGLIYLLLSAIALVMVAPFLFLVASSLKTPSEILAFPPTLLPEQWRFANYVETWRRQEFAHYLRNSVFIAGTRTLLTLGTTVLAGYAFARLRFPGRNIIFILFLTALMLPSEVTLIPLYVLVKRFPLAGGNDLLGVGGTGLINTYAGLILPHYVSVPAIFLLRQFFSTLPRELDDAARIDGCSELGILWRITLPLSTPALATVTIFAFQAYWNDFLWPLLVGQRKAVWTLQVALAHMRNGVDSGTIQWTELLAATVMATIPMVAVFLFLQRYFIRGIALTGLK